MHKMPYAALFTALLLTACVVVPAEPDVVIAPALPGIVVLDVEPYYYHGGFYYYYHDHDWSYSRDRGGPWKALPRERYPNEVKYKGRDKDDDRRGPPGRPPGY